MYKSVCDLIGSHVSMNVKCSCQLLPQTGVNYVLQLRTQSAIIISILFHWILEVQHMRQWRISATWAALCQPEVTAIRTRNVNSVFGRLKKVGKNRNISQNVIVWVTSPINNAVQCLYPLYKRKTGSRTSKVSSMIIGYYMEGQSMKWMIRVQTRLKKTNPIIKHGQKMTRYGNKLYGKANGSY